MTKRISEPDSRVDLNKSPLLHLCHKRCENYTSFKNIKNFINKNKKYGKIYKLYY
jgi:hypothetical protein